MNWEAIGAIGEILGAIAVVGSLVYVASQIKHNTAVSRSEALKEFRIEAARWQMKIAEDERLPPILNRLYHEGARRADLPIEDTLKAATAFLSMLNLLEASFHSAREGIITDSEAESLSSSSQLWHLPFVRDSWHIWRNELGADFVGYFEQLHPQLVQPVADAEVPE